jgi:GNAT superfamily N-acetyltransferase
MEKRIDIPNAILIESDGVYRIMAISVPENDCYIRRLVLLAMPDTTDDRYGIVGQLCVAFDEVVGETIDWIEVDPKHRRKGIGRRLWKAAEKVLGRELVHGPVTDDGEKFAGAMIEEEDAERLAAEIASDPEAMRMLEDGLNDVHAGRLHDHDNVENELG